MGLSWARNQRLNQAFLASIAIHVVIAMLIPALAVLNGDASSIETISFAQLIKVHIATPKPVIHPARALAPLHGAFPQVSRERAAAPSALRSAQRPVKHDGTRNRAPAVSAETRQGGASTQDGSGQAVAAQPQAEASSEAPRHEAGGYMPLGAQDPVPVLDPSVRSQLAALNVHVTLVVTVDDSGHTKTIEFRPPLDDETEARIRSMLASASWDPAICGGGIPCEGSATITL